MTEFMKMVRDSVSSGSNEQVMWHAVEVAEDLLQEVKESHPEKYDHYMRKMSEALFGCHYNEALAMEDVDAMCHTNENGEKIQGRYWSPEQVEAAWAGKKFPEGTTKFDRFVAANFCWHRFTGYLDDEVVLNVAYKLFFPEDGEKSVNVWKFIAILLA